MVGEAPWPAVVEVLKHEMAHQYVHETLGLAHTPPHGEAFQSACRLLRCDDRAPPECRAADSWLPPWAFFLVVGFDLRLFIDDGK